MQKSWFIGILVVVCLFIVVAGCTSQQAGKTVVAPTVTLASPDGNVTQATFFSLEKAPLNDTETADILFLQEEEKLEYDLNSALAAQHLAVPVFLSIANVSGTFMVADNVILDRYGIADPESKDPGVFTSQKLQQIYTTGVNNGLASVSQALSSSAAVEDMHIADLESAMKRTDNNDLIFIYEQECAASRNNLRALSQWIAAYGGTYSPTYISQDYYNQIISTPVEQLPEK
ncbi:MAG: DUF2202 domain-containing protein [Methanoregula sp.]|nr:DUF2202 domain-containing protein [Methanoregula sp.]